MLVHVGQLRVLYGYCVGDEYHADIHHTQQACFWLLRKKHGIQPPRRRTRNALSGASKENITPKRNICSHARKQKSGALSKHERAWALYVLKK